MRVGLASSMRLCLALVIPGISIAPVARGQSQPQPALPAKPQAATNTSPVKAQNSLKQLEESLRKSFQSFAPGNAEDNVAPPTYTPPPRAITPPPKAREKRKDLFSLSLEELLMPGAPGDSDLKLPGSKDDLTGRKFSWERFYEEFSHPPTNSAKSTNKKKDFLTDRTQSGAPRDPTGKEDDDTPSSIRDSEKRLKELLGDQNKGKVLDIPVRARSSFSDLFGMGDNNTMTPEQIKAHKDYLDQYRQLLDANSAPSSTMMNALNPGAGAADPSLRLAPYGTSPGLSQSPFPNSPAAMDAVLNPATLPDLNSKVFNAWNPFYVAPKIEPPKLAPAPVPTVQAPKRMF